MASKTKRTGSSKNGNSHAPTEQERDAILRQQTVLAQFRELALKTEDLDYILQEGCRLVGEALGTDLAKIITFEDGGRTLLVRAGIGWPPGVLGKRFPAEEDSSDCYALTSRLGPIISLGSAEEGKSQGFDVAVWRED